MITTLLNAILKQFFFNRAYVQDIIIFAYALLVTYGAIGTFEKIPLNYCLLWRIFLNQPGDVETLLCAMQMPHMTPYIRFCSCQLNSAALLQKKTETDPKFKEVHKVLLDFVDIYQCTTVCDIRLMEMTKMPFRVEC